MYTFSFRESECMEMCGSHAFLLLDQKVNSLLCVFSVFLYIFIVLLGEIVKQELKCTKTVLTANML